MLPGTGRFARVIGAADEATSETLRIGITCHPERSEGPVVEQSRFLAHKAMPSE